MTCWSERRLVLESIMDSPPMPYSSCMAVVSQHKCFPPQHDHPPSLPMSLELSERADEWRDGEGAVLGERGGLGDMMSCWIYNQHHNATANSRLQGHNGTTTRPFARHWSRRVGGVSLSRGPRITRWGSRAKVAKSEIVKTTGVERLGMYVGQSPGCCVCVVLVDRRCDLKEASRLGVARCGAIRGTTTTTGAPKGRGLCAAAREKPRRTRRPKVRR